MQKRTLLVWAAFFIVVLLSGCRGGGSTTDGPINTGTTFDPSKATATLAGKISFEGAPPPNDKIQMSSDPYCQMHSADYPTAETVKVSDGGLENVIVYISSGVQGSYPTPSQAVEINQQNCHYIPHVF